MNIRNYERVWDQQASSVREDDDAKTELLRVGAVLRRSYRSMLLCGAIFAALAVAFLFYVTPSFTSVVGVLLDEDRTGALTNVSGAASDHVDEYIATQVKMIQSDVIAERVADKLDLSFDGQLSMATSSTLDAIEGANTPIDEPPTAVPSVAEPGDAVPADTDTGTVAARPGGPGEASETVPVDPRKRILNALRSSITVYRLDQSFVIEIAAKSRSAELSQKIAEAYGQAYIDDQVASRLDANRRTGVWLEDRIESLRHQSLDASQAVQKYRADHKIVSTEGQLVSDQQLSGLSTQYVLAQETAAKAQARFDVYDEAMRKGDVDEVIGLFTRLPELPENSSARDLSRSYLQAADRLAAVTTRWGADNDQAAAITAEKERIAKLVLSEGQRIVGSYGSDAQIARRQLDALSAAMRSAAGHSENANETLVNLKSLEQRADSFQTLYQTYLQRYQEAVQQQSLPINSARIISHAEMPEKPVFPNKKVILALSLVLGLGVGGGLGVIREVLDRSFRSSEDMRALGVEFFGYIPAISKRRARRSLEGRMMKSAPNEMQQLQALTELFADGRQREMGEAVRHIKIALELKSAHSGSVVGITSIRRCEGKTLLAANLAHFEARNGRRVLLVDGNSGEPALSRLYAPGRRLGVSNALSGSHPLEDCIVTLPSGVSLLPVADRNDGAPGLDLATAATSKEMLAEWRSRFDLVVIDLPLVDASVETRALASRIDNFIFVARWGRTDKLAFQSTLLFSQTLQSRTLGAVLNMTDPRKLRLYDTNTPGPTNGKG